MTIYSGRMQTQEHGNPSEYGEAYYASHLGDRYERSSEWLDFFGGVADRIVASLHPLSTMDVGCAHGFLVEALAKRGVRASGIDFSEYAISQVHESVAETCSVRSATEPIEGSFDLITCVEVLEHLSGPDAQLAIANLTQSTDQILLSTTPTDFKESTHINVQPVEYWARLFAEQGFFRDHDYDASFLTPWAVLLRREDTSASRVIVGYERVLFRTQVERDELRQETKRLWALLDDSALATSGEPNGSIQQPSGQDSPLSRIEALTQELWSARDAIEGAVAAKGSAMGHLALSQMEVASLRAEHEEWEQTIYIVHEELHAAREELKRIKSSRAWQLSQGATLAAKGKRKLLG